MNEPEIANPEVDYEQWYRASRTEGLSADGRIQYLELAYLAAILRIAVLARENEELREAVNRMRRKLRDAAT